MKTGKNAGMVNPVCNERSDSDGKGGFLKWKKYKIKKGRFGPIYRVCRGVTVRQSNRGTWMIYLERNNQRKNISVGNSKDDLDKAIKMAEGISQKLQDVDRGVQSDDAKPEKTSFQDYSKEWLENNSPRWSPATYERYEIILRRHVLPRFKEMDIQDITRIDIKRFLQKLLSGQSSKSVELTRDVFSGIFEDAVEEGLVSANPTKGILKKILPPKNMRGVKDAEPFNRNELDLFIQTAEKFPNASWAEVLILKVMAYAGFRLGETLAMKAEYLDFNSMTYRVNESFKQHMFRLPKKGKKRVVDLPAFLVGELRDYIRHLRKESLKEGQGGDVSLLFLDPAERGYPYSQRKIQGLMKKICRSAGLRHRHPHDLRHTYASILLTSHKSPAYVQKQLGHHSIQITVDIYGHWFPGVGRENLDEVFILKENPKEMESHSGLKRTQNAHIKNEKVVTS